MAFFAANVNMPLEDAVKLFSKQSNYDEKKTRYYLNHAFGQGSSKTKYAMYSCSKMESLGICYKDETCKWKTPVLYYKNILPRSVKADKENKGEVGKK